MTTILNGALDMGVHPADSRAWPPHRRTRMAQATSSSLLHQVASGDGQAVGEVLDTYGPLVWSIARRYFGRSGEAEDAVQDAFIAVWKSAGRYDPAAAAESTFIAMIARRRMIDRLRQQGRRPATQPLEGSPEPVGESNDPLVDEEQLRKVLEAVDSLDPPQPEVIRRSLLDGQTHPEIAESMDLPLGTVKTHIRRGLIKVRTIVGVTTAEGSGAQQ